MYNGITPTFEWTSGLNVELVAKQPKINPINSVESSPKSSPKSSLKIIQLIQTNNHITISEIANNIGITVRGVKKQITNLKDNKLLKRVGDNRNGHWVIIENNQDII